MQQRKMKSERCIRVAVVESDPLRLAGFRALLGSEMDLQLATVSVSEIGVASEIDVVLLGKRPNQTLSQVMQHLVESERVSLLGDAEHSLACFATKMVELARIFHAPLIGWLMLNDC